MAVSGRLDEMRAGMGSNGGSPSEIRRAGGRLLAQRDGAWTDLTPADSAMAKKTIAAFSPAYFALVAARPALKAALAVGTSVTINGRRVRLVVADSGATAWASGELDRFLQEFEGR
jgi:hypothetical protein